MHRGGVPPRLFAPDLSEPAAQQGDDFLLNLRIVQQTQKHLFESLVLLGLLDLVFSFDSIHHHTIMADLRQSTVPVLSRRKKAAESGAGLGRNQLVPLSAVSPSKMRPKAYSGASGPFR
jgi:hypothetical protein